MEYHSDRFTDFSLLIFKKQKLIAVVPANLKEDTVYSHQGLTYGGLVVLKTLKFKEILTIFQHTLQYLENRNIARIIVKEIPYIYANLPNDELHYIFFLLNATLLERHLLTVVAVKENLKFATNRMEGYKRALKHKLAIKEEPNFDIFWETILVPNLKDKHQTVPVHSVNEIKYLHKRFPKNIKQFNVYNNEKIVAGATVFETQQVAHMQYISANNAKNKLGSLDFLFHFLITNRFKNKPYFDFGISNENKGRTVNEGLQYWKEGFGGRGVSQDFYEIETKNHVLLNAVFI